MSSFIAATRYTNKLHLACPELFARLDLSNGALSALTRELWVKSAHAITFPGSNFFFAVDWLMAGLPLALLGGPAGWP